LLSEEKIFYFAKGAMASAITYSIVETAKANNLLKYLFEKLPNIDTSNVDQLDELLPWFTSIPDTCKVPSKNNIITPILKSRWGLFYAYVYYLLF